MSAELKLSAVAVSIGMLFNFNIVGFLPHLVVQAGIRCRSWRAPLGPKRTVIVVISVPINLQVNEHTEDFRLVYSALSVTDQPKLTRNIAVACLQSWKEKITFLEMVEAHIWPKF